MSNTARIISIAWKSRFAVPAFNIPYLPMMRPIVQALADTRSFALIDVARLEWIKFGSGSMRDVYDEYHRSLEAVADARRFTRLHLDHVPVIDEDGNRVDYQAIITEAIAIGYESVMVDGSRLPFDENVEATRKVVETAHAAGIPVEAELGAVFGHEAGPLPSYEELYSSGRGFTDVDEAREFVKLTGVDWLSIAFGNIHGAISAAERKRSKQPAKLDIEHLERISDATGLPLVLHGGSGIPQSYVDRAIDRGIAKINIATDLRRAWESRAETDVDSAATAVYDEAIEIIERLAITGKADLIADSLEALS
jgi:fructose-bisphosphate aldolase, class II